MATKLKTVDAVGKVVSVLEALDHADRGRVIRAALTLLADQGAPEEHMLGELGIESSAVGGRSSAGEKAYFDKKEPRTKGEELAVAARYREERDNATASTRPDLERVIRAARRNFDGNNFRRDLENARTAGFFTRGTGRDSIVLSYYGQQYVDTLPNRDGLNHLRQPKKSNRRRGSGKGKPSRKPK
jgi:hypothetical protein